MAVAILLSEVSEARGDELTLRDVAAIDVGFVAVLEDNLRQERLIVDVVERQVVLLAIEGEDRQIAVTSDELNARNVVGFALEVDGLLRAVGDVVDV